MDESQLEDLIDEAGELFDSGYTQFGYQDFDEARACWQEGADLLRPLISNLALTLPLEAYQLYAACLSQMAYVQNMQGNLEQALENYKEAYRVDHAVAPLSENTATRLNNMGGVYQALGDIALALENYEAAYRIALQIAPDSPLVSGALSNIGDIYRLQGQLDKALANYEEAHRIDHALDPGSPEVAQDLNNIGLVHQDRGEMDEALATFAFALQLLSELGISGSITASLLTNQGNIYLQWGNLDQALDNYQRASTEVEHDTPQEASILNNIGMVHQAQGDLEYALEFFQDACAIDALVAPVSIDAASHLSNVGSVYREQGKLKQALESYEEARRILIEAAPTSVQMAGVSNNIGYVYQTQGKLDLALEKLEEAHHIYQTIAPESLETATSYNNLGYAYRAQNKRELALPQFQEAYRISQKAAPLSPLTAGGLNNIGLIYQEQGKLDLALSFYEKACRLLQELIPVPKELATSLTNIGSIYQLQGDFEQALEKFEEAYRIASEIAPESLETAREANNMGYAYAKQGRLDSGLQKLEEACRILEAAAPLSIEIVNVLLNIGEVYYDQEQFTEAFDRCAQAIYTVEELRKAAGGIEAASGVQSGSRNAYLNFITVAERRRAERDVAQAFAASELFKARGLTGRLGRSAFTPTPETDEDRELLERQESFRFEFASLLHRETQLRSQLHIAEISERDEEDIYVLSQLLAAVIEERQSLERAQEAHEKDVHARFPELAAFLTPEPLTLSAVQARVLAPGTLLLSYVVAGDRLYRFAIRSEEYELHCHSIPEALERTLTENVGTLFDSATDDTGPLKTALSELLLSGISESLWQGVTRLIVLPETFLFHLPFELLPWNDTVLGEAFAISYAPSATFLDSLRNLWDRRPGPGDSQAPFVGFGDPDSDGPISECRAGVGALPGANKETIMLAELMDGIAFVGPEATEEAVIKHAPAHRYVHFATHGYYDPKTPLSSGLHLAAPAEGHEGTGVLTVAQLFGLKLNAELVVCSACVSGLGEAKPGQGIEGMSTALLLAGAKNVLVTLWPVSDQSMRQFMYLFYDQLKYNPNQSVAESLKKARMDLREVFPQELHWAPVVLFGLG
ncbi:MAG: tetratricopeptide repeat protein [Armatimonas sp.]